MQYIWIYLIRVTLALQCKALKTQVPGVFADPKLGPIFFLHLFRYFVLSLLFILFQLNIYQEKVQMLFFSLNQIGKKDFLIAPDQVIYSL